MPIMRSYLRWTTNVYSIICNFDEVTPYYAIICSKRPPSVETHAGWSRVIWHNFVKIADNYIKICSPP